MRTKLLVTARALAAGVLACAACSTTSPFDQLPAGTWGGQGAELKATAANASIQYNCASGVISAVPSVGADGQFAWAGTYARTFPAPGTPPDTQHPATYHGAATRTHVTIAVTVPDLAIESEPVTLTLGQQATLALCP